MAKKQFLRIFYGPETNFVRAAEHVYHRSDEQEITRLRYGYVRTEIVKASTYVDAAFYARPFDQESLATCQELP